METSTIRLNLRLLGNKKSEALLFNQDAPKRNVRRLNGTKN